MGWLWLAGVCVLSLLPHPPKPLAFESADKLEHLLAYAWLMLWFCQVRLTTQERLRYWVGLSLLGVALEWLQGMGGYRYFEYGDMLANASGVLLGWGLAHTPMGRVIAVFEKR